MAESRLPGVLGAQSEMDLTDHPARTPGPMGLGDQGDLDLCTRMGDTPGTLGMFDLADVGLPDLFVQAGGWIASPGRSNTGVAFTTGRVSHVNASGGVSGRIDVERLQKIFTGASMDLLQKVCDELNGDLPKYGLDTVLRKAHFFAQVRQEAGPGMEASVEDMSYSAASLKAKFPYYGEHPDEADTDAYVRDPKTKKFTRDADQKTIASKAYSSKYGNGAPSTGDGYRFRGRGLIQVTWRDNYRAMARQYRKIYGNDAIDFEKDPELLSTFPYTVRSAVCFWLWKNLDSLADRGHSLRTWTGSPL